MMIVAMSDAKKHQGIVIVRFLGSKTNWFELQEVPTVVVVVCGQSRSRCDCIVDVLSKRLLACQVTFCTRVDVDFDLFLFIVFHSGCKCHLVVCCALDVPEQLLEFLVLHGSTPSRQMQCQLVIARPTRVVTLLSSLYELRTSPKQWQEPLRLEHNLTTIGLQTAQKRRLCVCQPTIDHLHHGLRRRCTCCWRQCYNTPFLQHFQRYLELKHASQLTKTAPLEFLGKTIELQGDGTIHLSIAPQYDH
eukprot:5479511-Amphidinium_carterae.2